MAVYNQIGVGYDATRRADPYLVSRLADLLRLRPGLKYLDLACGTGNYTTALSARCGGEWTGLDVSDQMIEEARAKENQHKGDNNDDQNGDLTLKRQIEYNKGEPNKNKAGTIDWLVGDCGHLPFGEAVFCGVICTLAVHHFGSIEIAFSEVARVLACGRFVILTSTPEQMEHYWLCEYFPRAMKDSARQMPSLPVLEKALSDAGLEMVCTEPYDVRPDLQDFFLYSGKHRPSIYLDARVRAGISTFALLADPLEVEEGLARLTADIASGEIAEVQARYRHDGGDYLFVVAQNGSSSSA